MSASNYWSSPETKGTLRRESPAIHGEQIASLRRVALTGNSASFFVNTEPPPCFIDEKLSNLFDSAVPVVPRRVPLLKALTGVHWFEDTESLREDLLS